MDSVSLGRPQAEARGRAESNEIRLYFKILSINLHIHVTHQVAEKIWPNEFIRF